MSRMKVCRKCNTEKPESEFNKNKTRNDGLQSCCNSCKLEYQHNAPNRQAVVAKYGLSSKGKVVAAKYRASDKGKIPSVRYRVSEAGKLCHDKHQKDRYETYRVMSDFDSFVFEEAKDLIQLRNDVTGVKWHTDHIIPISKGGTSEYTNIQVVPARYNRYKYDRIMQPYFPRGK